MPNYVDILKMEGHQEGGYFSTFYKSLNKLRVNHSRFHSESSNKESNHAATERHTLSSIYFLLEKQGFSAWHRLKSDEVWHYYAGGSPIKIYLIDAMGDLQSYVLGDPAITENASFHAVIKAGLWFAAEVEDKSSFGLVGCTVCPAFEYEDFELAEPHRDTLVEQYPKLSHIIDRFIKPSVEKKELQNESHHPVHPLENQASAQYYLQKLGLKSHHNGGHFAINYEAQDMVLPLHQHSRHTRDYQNQEPSPSPAGSSMYLLLKNQEGYHWNQPKHDKILHYYTGNNPVAVHVFEQGVLKTKILGNPQITQNAEFQMVIKAGDPFAIEVNKDAFCLLGCSMSPGLVHKDLVLIDQKQLTSQYPEHADLIARVGSPAKKPSWVRQAIGYTALTALVGFGLYSLFGGKNTTPKIPSEEIATTFKP